MITFAKVGGAAVPLFPLFPGLGTGWWKIRPSSVDQSYLNISTSSCGVGERRAVAGSHVHPPRRREAPRHRPLRISFISATTLLYAN